jgi:hypothetical protein
MLGGQGPGVQNNIEIRNLTLDGNGYIDGVHNLGNVAWTNWTAPEYNTRFTNVRCQTLVPGTISLYETSVNGLTLSGCQFVGNQVFLLGCDDALIDSCSFFGTPHALSAVSLLGTSHVSITNSTAQDNDSTNPGEGRFLYSRNAGSEANVYFGDNVSTALGPLPDDNAGEQVLCEGDNYIWQTLNPTNATSNTFAITNPATNYSMVAVTAAINNGKGLGQYRQVTGYDPTTGTVTVSPDWNVIPDSTSNIIMMGAACRWVMYSNILQGKDYYAQSYSAMSGLSPEGGCFEWIGDSNTLTNMRTGLYISASQNSAGLLDPILFNYYANNLIQDCYQGIGAGYCTSKNPSAGIGFIGNVFRNNNVSDITTDGVYEAAVPPGLLPMDMTLFEHNTFTNLPEGFDCSGANGFGAPVGPSTANSLTQNTILYKNKFELGTATATGAFGINFGTNTLDPALRENTWTGFETTDAGTPPGATLNVPVRNFNMSATASGGAQTAYMTIWNSGTAPINWTATSDSNWLTLSSGSGTIPNQNSNSTVTLTCNPAGLAPGTYTGTVTVSGASQTMTITVTFTVSQ